MTESPSAPAALVFQRALALHQQGELALAEDLYREILRQQPGHAEALHLLGVLAFQRGQPEAATDWIGQAIRSDPANPASHYNLGIALQHLKRHDDALTSFDHALALKPENAEVLNSRGGVLQACQRFAEALTAFEQALAIDSDYVDALNNRGVALENLQRYDEALASFDRALVLKADSAEIHFNRGNALQHCKRSADALASYDRALAISPDYTDALHNRAVLLQSLKRYDEAMICYQRVLAINADYPLEFGNWLHTKMLLCDWNGLSGAFQQLSAALDAGRRVTPPFPALAMPVPPFQQRACAESYARDLIPAGTTEPYGRFESRDKRIRLGYISADFRDHPVAHLTAGLFEAHDRGKFELFAFAFGPEDPGPMRTRLKGSFDQFIDVEGRSDAEIALLARALGIHIAVDLMGYTLDSRPGIFARRAAPVQVSYLGYPGTMGADFIDYLIADQTVVPREHAGFYTETIAWLPHSFQANDSHRHISDRQFTRQDAGLPGNGFVFCNFNQCYKFNPGDFDIWMRLLTKVEGSVLWLAGTNATAEHNLRNEASARRVAPGRLIFKKRTALLPDHLAQLRLADLFLDSAWFNAHTTGSDALWAGLPLLTRLGETYASRVAASLLKAVGLPELITESPEAYDALALALATDAPRLAALRQRLASNRLTCPLFDTARFTRHIEAAYTTMWQQHEAGRPPEHIIIPP